MKLHLLAACAVLILSISCAHAGRAGRAGRSYVEPIPTAEYDVELRRFMRMGTGDPARDELRARLLATILVEAQGRADIGDYEGTVSELERMSSLLRPTEYTADVLPAQLKPIAEYVAAEGGHRGDEGRALAANLLLARITGDEAYEEEYARIAEWGHESRSEVPNVLQTYGELIDVWTAHANITPTPEVLNALAQLHLDRRDAVVGETEEFRSRFGVATARISRIAPLDVAAVYLAHGDVTSAVRYVEAMGTGDELQLRLLELLQRAERDDADGADATFELVEGFRVAKPEVALGLCENALHRFPQDFRFPACLARVAAEDGRFADATAWYLVAIDLAPGSVELYDEALGQLDEFIELRLTDPRPERSKELARGAEEILRERQQRWPGSKPPIAPDRLHYLIGMLEMNAGHAMQAQQRFEASIAAEENPAALLQLGLLLERTGRPAAAEERYRRALALIPSNTRADALRRAEVLEHLADAASVQGKDSQARQQYQSALDAWTKERDNLEGPSAALVEIRRGTLLDYLGRHEEALDAFQSAMAAAPQWREVYASILSHLVVSDPDLAFANQVWRRAQFQLNLPPEWKVYFTLWMQLIAARAGEPASEDYTELLRRLSQPSTWWGKLASFGAADIDYPQLLESASDLGERTEAFFYEGTRLLVAGDTSAAETQLQRVLDTHMVSFYEYEMARKLLRNEPKGSQAHSP
jgi:tetratricopeptide (TPR) repeat protein